MAAPLPCSVLFLCALAPCLAAQGVGLAPDEELAPGDHIELPLLGAGLSLDRALCTVDRRELRASGWSLSGRVATRVPGTFVLVREAGELAGWLQLPGLGEFALDEIDGAVRARNLRRVPLQCATPAASAASLSASSLQRRVPNAAPMGPLAPPRCDDGAVIDLLVLHTPAAASQPNSAGVSFAAFVQLAAGAANQAFLVSGTGASVRIVGVQPVNYTEAGVPFLEHLVRLSTVGDGHLDEAHVFRDQARADLVTLYMHVPGQGGAAWFPYGPESGFSIHSVTSGVGTLTHELGHNLGCDHDIASVQAAGVDPRRRELSFAFGHRFNAGGATYTTVMALAGPGQQELLQFGHPGVLHLGVPTGVPPGAAQPAANAFTVRAHRGEVASYRDDGFADCNANGRDDAVDILSGTSLDEDGDGVPDECEHVLYVDASAAGGDGRSWGQAWPDLRDALWSASQRCSEVREVWVADGAYLPDRGTLDREQAFQFDDGASLVFGGFVGNETLRAQRAPAAHVATLTGDLLGDDLPGFQLRGDNAFNVVRVDAGRHTLDGLTLRGGNADGAFPFDGGGALRAQGGRPTLRDCALVDNRGTRGGALHLYFSPPGLCIEGSLLADNEGLFEGGALTSITSGKVDLVDCDVRDNSAPTAGAALLFETRARVAGSTFARNSATSGDGGALWTLGSELLRIDACTFAENTALLAGGAVYAWQTPLDARRSTFRRNRSQDRGGAVYAGAAPAALTSCASLADSAALEGGGFYAYDCDPIAFTNLTVLDATPEAVFLWDSPGLVTSSLLWDSGGAPLFRGGAPLAAVSYCDIQGGYPGVGNRALAPLLVSARGPDGIPGTGDEDLAPALGSPCVDAGNTPALAAHATLDLAGGLRRRDDPLAPDVGLGPAPVVDIGARER